MERHHSGTVRYASIVSNSLTDSSSNSSLSRSEVPWSDALSVGSLMGIKVVLNEFVAYSKMDRCNNCHQLSQKSIIIATYALCGFANSLLLQSRLVESARSPRTGEAIFAKLGASGRCSGERSNLDDCFNCRNVVQLSLRGLPRRHKDTADFLRKVSFYQVHSRKVFP